MLKANRSRRRIAAAIATGCAGLALAGAAQAVDLRDWGKKYATSERFVVLAEFGGQAVLDKETQLVWQRAPLQQANHLAYARLDCANGHFGGRRGWRLPSLHELATLADPSAASGAVALPAGHPFQSVQASKYLTMTRHIIADGSLYTTAYVVDFANRGATGIAANFSSLHRVWCVRGGGPANRY